MVSSARWIDTPSRENDDFFRNSGIASLLRINFIAHYTKQDQYPYDSSKLHTSKTIHSVFRVRIFDSILSNYEL